MTATDIEQLERYDGEDTTKGRLEEMLANLTTGATAATAEERCDDG